MPVRPTFPGVYIEEVPSGVRTIVGVATSVAAFIDYFAHGPMNRAIQIFSFADFEREFGGLDALSEASYAIQQFFLNGGTEAYVIRTGNSFATASIELLDGLPVLGSSLRVTAGRLIKGVSVDDPGTWGNFVRLDVDYDTTDPSILFNLTVSEVSPSGIQPVLRTETFRNLTMTPGVPNSAVDVINEGSRIVQVTALGANRPAQTGTVGNALSLGTIASPFQCDAAISGGPPFLVDLGPTAPTTPQQVRTLLEAGLRANTNDPRYSNATVQLIGGLLRVLTGRAGATPGSAFDPDTTIAFTENGGNTAAALGLLGVTPNVQQNSLGGTALGFQTTPIPGANSGNNGNRPVANDIIGVRANKTGLFALEEVDIFNVLCIPRAADLTAPEPFNVYSAAEAYCLERRAFLIVDIPSNIDTVQEMKDFLDSNAGLRNRNAAIYFPRLRIADSLNQFRLRDFAPSGRWRACTPAPITTVAYGKRQRASRRRSATSTSSATC